MYVNTLCTEDNIYDLIKTNMEKVPKQIALIDGENKISYDALKIAISIFATKYLESIQKQDIVVLYLEKSSIYIVAILAVMHMGAVYIPMDKNCPKGRLSKICEQSGAKLLITDEAIENCAYNSIVVDRCEAERIINKSDNISFESHIFENACITTRNEMAYIIFTSGSTGIPKGIVIEYQNLFNLVMALHKNIYKDETYLTFAVIASFAFDSSVKQIFSALCFGHSLVIINDSYKKNPIRLMKILNEYKVDVLDITPTFMSLLNSDKKRTYDKLKYLLFGGEALTPSHVHAARSIFGDMVNIYNLYGPSECCVDVSFYRIPFNITGSTIPIGNPLDNIRIEINSGSGTERVGEIIVSGACVGRGYINADRGGFYVDKNGNRKYRTGDLGYIDKGLLYFVGRMDNQIKLNGNRIELSEIDSFISSQKEIDFSFTVIVEMLDYKFIVNFYKADIDMSDVLKKQLKEYLPEYMMPKKLILIKDINYTVNGKVDKKYYEKRAREALIDNGKNS